MQLFHEKLHFRGLLGIFRGIKKEKTREKKDGMKTKNGLKQTSIHFFDCCSEEGSKRNVNIACDFRRGRDELQPDGGVPFLIPCIQHQRVRRGRERIQVIDDNFIF